ncbi:unnamed protein product [Arabidopsis halleri]
MFNSLSCKCLMLCLKGSVFCFVSVSFAGNLDFFSILIARFNYLCPNQSMNLDLKFKSLI